MLLKKNIILIDLPIFPKGTITLSLATVASLFKNEYECEIIDLNIKNASYMHTSLKSKKNLQFIGLKVSTQSFEQAIFHTKNIKKNYPNLPIIWGGEMPSLLPDECLKYADSIVQGLFEPIVLEFITDLENKNIKRIYSGSNNTSFSSNSHPLFSLIESKKYFSFMGFPIETSRGCTEVCAFCMVHIMQRKYHHKTQNQLEKELQFYKGKFVNVIDYNFGVSESHATQTALAFKKARVNGWMAEMCIEQLDNDELLKIFSESGCRIIYCGLETIEEIALQGVHKMNTNYIENYERIIRKVQSYGIQIASGFILGINGMTTKTFENTFDFFQRMGIIYAKLTFLTYNPGTKVAKNMSKKGVFLTDDVTHFDGNHLSYLPHEVDSKIVKDGTYDFIQKFYSLQNIAKRSLNTKMKWNRRLEFILFNYLFRATYMKWLKYDILNHTEKFNQILYAQFRKSKRERVADYFLKKLRYYYPI